MDSFKRATEMIIKLQDEKMELRLALGKLLQLCKNTKMDEASETWWHIMGVATEAMINTDVNNKNKQ